MGKAKEWKHFPNSLRPASVPPTSAGASAIGLSPLQSYKECWYLVAQFVAQLSSPDEDEDIAVSFSSNYLPCMTIGVGETPHEDTALLRTLAS